MTLLMLALLIAFSFATLVVLADSGLRLWSALAAQQAQTFGETTIAAAGQRQARPPRATMRVSFARKIPLRAVA